MSAPRWFDDAGLFARFVEGLQRAHLPRVAAARQLAVGTGILVSFETTQAGAAASIVRIWDGTDVSNAKLLWDGDGTTTDPRRAPFLTFYVGLLLELVGAPPPSIAITWSAYPDVLPR